MKNFKIQTLFCLIFYIFTLPLKSEGTKQIRPSYTDDVHIVSMASDNNFAAYDSPNDNRLQFHISSLTERVYFGFGNLKLENNPASNNGGNIATYDETIAGYAGNVYYRIIDPLGNIVKFGTVPKFGQGYIGNESMGAYNRAVNGPKQLVGITGYFALKFTPKTVIGDYRIEFNIESQTIITHVKTSFQLFDLTVTNGKGSNDLDATDLSAVPPFPIAISGRLWSKSWRMSTGANQSGVDQQNLVKCKLYPYAEDGNILTNDGVVTEINFNGMDPFGFSVSCNRDGISNATGNFVLDKQSVYNFVTNLPSPLYKIFLQDPDNITYPSGVVGCITKDPTVTQCASSSAYCINVYATSVGDVSIIIDLDNNGVYEPNTSDVLLQTSINGDYSLVPKCVAWNGKDGFGVQVPNGNIPIIVAFHAGLTNLPINDVENNKNGFQVSLVRPIVNACGNLITPPKLYWSDKKVEANTIAPYTAVIIDGIENLMGCDPTIQGVGIGCHRWSGRGNNSDPTGMGYVMETMNTWWYVAEDKRTISFNNDNSLFGLSANFGNVSCAFKDFDKIRVDVEYSVAKFEPNNFTYTITPPTLDNYVFINQNIINNSLPGSTINKRIARIEYTVDINKDGINTGAINNGLSFDYLVQTNQCGTPQSISQKFVCSVPLPVTWIYISANRINNNVIVEWTTTQEKDNTGFWIEKSLDGKSFVPIKFVPQYGGNKYVFIDKQPSNGVIYYRLKQIDINESFNYSKIVSVSFENQDLITTISYNNQLRQLNMNLLQNHTSDVNVTIYSMLGFVVNRNTFIKIQPNVTVELKSQLNQLSTGIYMVEIRNDIKAVKYKILITE